MMRRLSLALLRLFARIVPARQRDAWLDEWESEFDSRRSSLVAGRALTRRQEVAMFRRVLGSFHDAAWLRRQFTRDADVVHDLRHGVRLLRRTPGTTLLAVGVLALGIGATTGIFTVVDALLIRQLPYREPERIALLFEAAAASRSDLDAVAPANFIDWQSAARSIEVMAAAEPYGFTYAGRSELQSLPGARVTQGFFEAFGIPAMYGRTFAADEYTPGRHQVVVLSYGVWAQRFGADPSVVGAAIRLNGQPHTVVGVMPPAFAPRLLVTFNERGVWTPKIWSEPDRHIRGSRFYNAVARLKTGVTMSQAQQELDAIAARLSTEYPRTNEGKTVQLVSLRDHLAGDLRPSLLVLATAALLLLAIAIANTAHLLMARALERSREIAVRTALGAQRGRVMRQLLAETLLATLGCLCGLFVAHATTRVIVLLAPADIPALARLGVNGRVLVFSSVLTVAVAMLVGLFPAVKGTRIRILAALSGAATGTAAVHTGRQRTRFVVAELAVALTLLMAAGLLLRSFSRLLDISPGFTADGVAAVQIFARLPDSNEGQRAVYSQQIVEAMRTLPDVREVGAASVIPFLNTTGGSTVPVIIEGRPAPARGEEPSALVNVATPGYFPTMRIRRQAGRIFNAYDDDSRAPVAVISETFAVRHWRRQSPVGEHIQFMLRGTKLRAEIIGVVSDLRYEALDRPTAPEVFVPHAQVPLTDMTFVARASGTDPRVLAGSLKSRLTSVAPNQPVYRTATLPDLVADSMSDRRFMMTLVVAFAPLAVALAASGVYAVMRVVSAQRTKEYGLRVALGADRSEILGMVMREGALITGLGIAVGLAGALAAGQVLRGFLFGIAPTDLWTLAAVCMVLGAIAAAACLLPALRATRVSPLVALRTD